MGSLHFNLGIPWALNRGTFGGRERAGDSRRATILYDIPASSKTFLENTWPQSCCNTVATLPTCFSITNASQIPWNFKAAESRWTKLRQALSRLTEAQSMAEWKAASNQMGWTRSIADTSLQTQSIHCDRYWKSSSWCPEAAAQSRPPQTQTQPFSKGSRVGHKALLWFPLTHSSSSAIAEPEAVLQTCFLLLLLTIWHHFTCSRNLKCNETTVAKPKLAMEKAVPAQDACVGSVLKAVWNKSH